MSTHRTSRPMRVNHAEPELENHDRGLDVDLPRLIGRRGLLTLAIGAGTATTVGCSAVTDTPATGTTAAPSSAAGTADSSASAPASSSTTDLEAVPEETAGPFPGDGSNGVNILDDAGIVRSDITASFGGSTTVAEGVPLKITMTILDDDAADRPLAGAAVYVWHCSIDGQYSLYSAAIAAENYLRGVQETDAAGQVSFTSIFPAAYDGRWPHIHFEVYPSLAQATNGTTKIATSQMALPEDVCRAVYATSGYEQSLSNLGRTSLDRDNVFGDGYDLQLPTVTGSTSAGYAVEFTCAV